MRQNIIFCVIALFCTARIEAASDGYTAVIREVTVEFAIGVYEKVSGTKVTVSEEVKSSKAQVSFRFKKQAREDAMRIIEKALLEQANVCIKQEPNGVFIAKIASD